MKFIDEAKIEVHAGHGGRGCVSFRREKYVPRGGPNGGNGGKGGDVVLCTDEGLNTLLDFRYKRVYRAGNGQIGKGKNQDGSAGEDVMLKVPLGTVVYDDETGEVEADLDKKGETVVIAKGGRGGKGNAHFTTSTNQAPKFAQDGEAGEKKTLRLELKLLADVGLVGLPNAGKSTLLSVISKAQPKIADYPFTTLQPVLGVVAHKTYPPFTVADIPGLIEGAHRGAGLGDRFLKHIERTKMILHLISLGPDEPSDPLERFETIKKEMEAFDPQFKKRPQAVVLTKLDLHPDKKDLYDVEKLFKKKKYPVFTLSAVTGEGLEELLQFTTERIQKLKG